MVKAIMYEYKKMANQKRRQTKVSEECWWVVDDEGKAAKCRKCKRECAYASLVV